MIILISGLLYTPLQAFACGGSHDTAVHSSDLEISCKEECCSEGSDFADNHQNHKQCQGKCGHAGCNCTLVQHSPALLAVFSYNSVDTFLTFKKLSISYSERLIQSACTALRLPPKIS